MGNSFSGFSSSMGLHTSEAEQESIPESVRAESTGAQEHESQECAQVELPTIQLDNEVVSEEEGLNRNVAQGRDSPVKAQVEHSIIEVDDEESPEKARLRRDVEKEHDVASALEEQVQNEAQEIGSSEGVHAGDDAVEEVEAVSEVRAEKSVIEVVDKPSDEVEERAVSAAQEVQVEEEKHFEETIVESNDAQESATPINDEESTPQPVQERASSQETHLTRNVFEESNVSDVQEVEVSEETHLVREVIEERVISEVQVQEVTDFQESNVVEEPVISDIRREEVLEGTSLEGAHAESDVEELIPSNMQEEATEQVEEETSSPMAVSDTLVPDSANSPAVHAGESQIQDQEGPSSEEPANTFMSERESLAGIPLEGSPTQLQKSPSLEEISNTMMSNRESSTEVHVEGSEMQAQEQSSSQAASSENAKRSFSSMEEAQTEPGPSNTKRRKTGKPKSTGSRKSSRSSGKKREREPEESDKKSKKRRTSKEKTPENDEEAQYEIERIVDHAVYRNMVVSYKVKWAGYPESENTTEPANVLHSDCPELCAEYWENREPRPKNAPSRRQLNARQDEADSRQNDAAVGGSSAQRLSYSAKLRNVSSPELQRFIQGHGFQLAIDLAFPNEITNWHEQLRCIHTIRRVPVGNSQDSQLLAYVSWANGNRTVHAIEELHEKCPDLLLKYYESHVRFQENGH